MGKKPSQIDSLGQATGFKRSNRAEKSKEKQLASEKKIK